MSTIAWIWWAVFLLALALWVFGMYKEITSQRPRRVRLPRGYGRIARMARYWGFW